jgi:hypothetical protein
MRPVEATKLPCVVGDPWSIRCALGQPGFSAAALRPLNEAWKQRSYEATL